VPNGNGHRNRNDQLNRPKNVIVDKEIDCLIISDCGNRRVVRWSRRKRQNEETIIFIVACLDFIIYLYVFD
jgi:hypothetical protein